MRIYHWIKQLASQWSAHGNTRTAAAVSYYAIFALAPTLVFATAIVGMFVGDDEAQSLIKDRLTEAIGQAGAEVADDVLDSTSLSGHSIIATSVSAVFLFFGASAMFVQSRKSLNDIFGHEKKTGKAAFLTAVLGRLIGILLVIGAGGLMISTLVATVILHGISQWIPLNGDFREWSWQLIEIGVSSVTVAIIFFTLLVILPDKRPPIRHVIRGALIVVAFFELSKWLIGIYISRSFVASAYGPSSSIVAIILWIYCCAHIFLFGAEVCKLSWDHEQQQPPTDQSAA